MHAYPMFCWNAIWPDDFVGIKGLNNFYSKIRPILSCFGRFPGTTGWSVLGAVGFGAFYITGIMSWYTWQLMLNSKPNSKKFISVIRNLMFNEFSIF